MGCRLGRDRCRSRRRYPGGGVDFESSGPSDGIDPLGAVGPHRVNAHSNWRARSLVRCGGQAFDASELARAGYPHTERVGSHRIAMIGGPAVAGALVVVLAALIARELGGGRRAQLLTALAVVISPMFLGGNFIFETVSFDQLVWALLLWLVARVLAGRDPRLWLLAGVVLGIGLETKYTVAGLAVALAAGLLLTPARRHLATRWPWLGAALAVVLLLPNLWWQSGHGWDSVAYTLPHRGNTDGPVADWPEQELFPA